MVRLAIFSGFILFSICAKAQVITFIDSVSRQPVSNVELISNSPEIFGMGNDKGRADLEPFKSTLNIFITATGYKSIFTTYADLIKLGSEVYLQPGEINLAEVVISVTKWKQNSGSTPNKVITIPVREAEIQNPQTAADLLGISGKVFIQKSQQGGGSPMIRGFATNRLLYSVDGVRMNSAIFRSGNIQNVINLDPFATEHTEVLFGPGSVIYGSDAIGGVMSFQTLRPKLSNSDTTQISGKAVVRTATANAERTGHFDVTIGAKKWSFVTSFSSWDFDHLKQGSHGPDDYLKNIYVVRQDSIDVIITQDDPLLQIPSAYSQFNLMQKVRFNPNDHWDVEYGFHYSATSPYGRYDRHNRYRNGTLRYSEWKYGDQIWMLNNLSVLYTRNSKLFDHLNIRLSQQLFEESRIDRSLNSISRNTQTENVSAYSVNLDLVKATSQKNSIYYGVEYVNNSIESQGAITDITNNTSKTGPSRYPESSWNSFGVYLNNIYNVTRKASIQTGIRYSHYLINSDYKSNLVFYPFPFETSELDKGAVTGSIGVVYHPATNWVIKSNFGTAYRAPNVDDIGKVFDSEPGAVTVPNPGLEEEYAYNLDLGMAKIFNDVVKIDITGFYTLLKNAMVRRDYQINGQDSILYDGVLSQVQAIQNAAEAFVYGLQLSAEIKLTTGLTFITDWNFQAGEEEMDDGTKSTLRHAAPLFGTTRLEYQYKKMLLECYIAYQSEKSHADLSQEERSKDEIYAKDKNGNNYAPSWYTLNLKAMYTFNAQFSLSCGIENITDQRYRPYSSGISGPGRNFIISLKAAF